MRRSRLAELFLFLFLTCLLTLNDPTYAGLLFEEPNGITVGTEFEANQEPTDTSGNLIQNFSLTPHVGYGTERHFAFKANFSFGTSLSSQFQMFMYDFQIRFEVADLFFIGTEPVRLGTWIFFPTSRVSRDEDVYGSLMMFLDTARYIGEEKRWEIYGDLSFRMWVTQFKTRNMTSTHPQQRSTIHDIQKFLKDDAVNDLFSIAGRFGVRFDVAQFSETNKLWMWTDLTYRYAYTYADTAAGHPRANYGTVFWLIGTQWTFSKHYSVDLSMQNVGRTGGPKALQLFGRGTTYFFGINVEI